MSVPPRSTGEPAPLDEQRIATLHRDLRALARALVGREEVAEDLVQEAWLAALDASPGRVRDLGAWLGGTVRNLARRHHHRTMEEAQRSLELARATPGDGEEPVEESSRELLLSAVEELRDPYRQVLHLRFFEGMDVEQVARHLARPPATVRSQISRGIGELRAVLDRRHLGDRSAWSAVLLPLALRRGAREATPAALGARSLSLAAALLAAFGSVLGIWWWSRDVARGAPEVEVRQARLDRTEGPPTLAVSDAPLARSAGEVPTLAPAPRTRSARFFVRGQDGVPTSDAMVAVLRSDGGTDFLPCPPEGLALVVPEPELLELAGGRGVRVRAWGAHEASSRTVAICLPEDGSERRFTIETRGPACTVDGVVLDPGGVPVEGAFLRLGPRGAQGSLEPEEGVRIFEQSYALRTDGDGRFAFEHEPAATRVLYVFAEGFLPERRDVLPAVDGAPLSVRLRLGGTLEGTVRDAAGRPVAGADVRVQDELLEARGGHPPRATSDTDGRYRLRAMAPEPAHVFATGPDGIFDATVASVPEADTCATWDPVLRASPGVRVQLVDARGAPVAGAWTMLTLREGEPPFAIPVTTDAEGRATWSELPGGDYALLVRTGASDLVELPQVLVARAEEWRLSVPGLEPRDSALFGVLLEADGSPVTHAVLYGSHDFDPYHADVDPRTGAFRAQGLRAGEHVLRLGLPGRGMLDLGTFTLRTGEGTDVGEWRLRPTAPVELRWGAQRPSAEEPWRLMAVPDCLEPLGLLAIAPLEEAIGHLDLLPGNYSLGPAGCFHDGRPRGVAFTVPPEGGEVVVDVRLPDAPR